jgi:plastocyanin
MSTAAVKSGRVLAAGLCLALASCGGGGTTGPTPPGPTNPNVITIGSGGVATPKDLTVAPGARVLFVNNDGRRHDMSSDDHPDHLECPAINQVGLLMPSQNRESGNLIVVRTCGFHDHEDPDNNNLKGRIVVR